MSKYGSGHNLAASLREYFDASDECRFCEMKAVENVEHVMLSCSLYSEARAELLRHLDDVFDLVKFHSLTPLENIVTLLGEANVDIAKIDQQMFWQYNVTNNFLYKISVTRREALEKFKLELASIPPQNMGRAADASGNA